MEHTDFIGIYTNWIKANSAQRIVNGFTEITTPFLDAHNDAIQFYVQRKENDFFLLILILVKFYSFTIRKVYI